MSSAEELLQKITNLLIASVEDRKLMMSTMQEMLEASEKRIEATNEKVSQLVQICDRMSKCYEEQICNMTISRDRMAAENEKLIGLLCEAQADSRMEKEKFDRLLSAYIDNKIE